MKTRVVVWGTGNVGRPAIRAVHSHANLDLVGVVVASESKVGQDAGTIAGIETVGVLATNDWPALRDAGVDAVVYTATADIRPEAALADLLDCLANGIDVVSTSFHPLLYPPAAPAELVDMIEQACQAGNSSLFVSGIDPGWVMDALPLFASAMSSDIEEIRTREIFNYALYDQPEVVRDVIGFGTSMDETPPMLLDFSLRLVWEGMVRVVAEGLGQTVDEVVTHVERRPLEKDVHVEQMGLFEAGTQGAFRFEVAALCGGQQRFVVEHVTRIDEDCAPDWPYPPEGQGVHQVIIKGSPCVTLSVHGEDPVEPGAAGGGNATAACRVVNAIEAVRAARTGLLSTLDLPSMDGAAQMRA